MNRLTKYMIIVTASLAGGCGDPVQPLVTEPISIADGRFTFTPEPGIEIRGASLRLDTSPSTNDNRWLPGSVFRFDPGKSKLPGGQPGWVSWIGILRVSYDGVLPPGVEEASLFLARWNPDNRSWEPIISAVDVAGKFVEARPIANMPATYALLSPRGMSVSVALETVFPPSLDSLRVNAWAKSDVELSSVTARLQDRVVTLDPVNANWRGWISLMGMHSGTRTLYATVTRADGMTMRDSISVNVKRPPFVTVIEPQQDDWVAQKFRLRATCTDDDPAPCSAIHVDVGQFGYRGPYTRLATAQGGTFDQVIDLGGWKGVLELRVLGVDGTGDSRLRIVKVGSQ